MNGLGDGGHRYLDNWSGGIRRVGAEEHGSPPIVVEGGDYEVDTPPQRADEHQRQLIHWRAGKALENAGEPGEFFVRAVFRAQAENEILQAVQQRPCGKDRLPARLAQEGTERLRKRPSRRKRPRDNASAGVGDDEVEVLQHIITGGLVSVEINQGAHLDQGPGATAVEGEYARHGG